MPQVRFRGVQVQEVRHISTDLVDRLVDIVDSPRDYFTLEYLPITFIAEGQEDPGYPLIDVYWFDRGQKVQNEVALVITEIVRGLGYEEVEIIFHHLVKEQYYANGKHY